MERITYASPASLGEEHHRAFETALVYEQKKLGRSHPLFIRGQKKKGNGTFADTNPANPSMVLGEFQSAGREETRLAIGAARAALADWQELGWAQRISFLRKAAEIMTEKQYRLAALLCLEVGKSRFEAVAEVSECIDLLLYYCRQAEAHHGFVIALGGTGQEQTRSVLKPYGAWAVVSPYNFPLALPVGMSAGVMLGGNTVVFKPASDTPLLGYILYEIFHEAGLPVGVFNLLTGPGATIGEELVTNPDVDGFAFAGSKAVGLNILRRFGQERWRPCLAEMGGKNPVIILPSANLEDAADGVLRSAFAMGGQKRSACSRLYVHQNIYKRFVELLAEKTRQIVLGDPLRRETFLGPLINEEAVKRFVEGTRVGQEHGRIIVGGKQRPDLGPGFFVEPTLIESAAPRSRLFQEEWFAPILALAEVKSLAEAIGLANDSEYGLSAGIFTQEEHEQETFFDLIQAGTVYSNRRGGATTGAWPGVQPLAGWKHSGSSGKGAMGPYYVSQFLREQSQTRMKLPSDSLRR